jgi:hypothetical protein
VSAAGGEPTAFQKAWEDLRYPIKTTLREIVKQDTGHYAAALLIVIGCEGLSRLLKQPDHHIFVKELITPHRKITEGMARDLWEALRQGLAHIYDTNFIGVAGKNVEIVVSLRELPHLTRRDSPPGIYLNIETMHRDLDKIFEQYHHEFWADPTRKLPEHWVRNHVEPAAFGLLADWREFLGLDRKERT